jgi:hypothetical protein
MEVDESGQVLGVRQPTRAGAGAEAHRRFTRYAPQHDVLVILARRAFAAVPEEEHVAVRAERRRGHRNRELPFELLVVAHGSVIALIAHAVKTKMTSATAIAVHTLARAALSSL